MVFQNLQQFLLVLSVLFHRLVLEAHLVLLDPLVRLVRLVLSVLFHLLVLLVQ